MHNYQLSFETKVPKEGVTAVSCHFSPNKAQLKDNFPRNSFNPIVSWSLLGNEGLRYDTALKELHVLLSWRITDKNNYNVADERFIGNKTKT